MTGGDSLGDRAARDPGLVGVARGRRVIQAPAKVNLSLLVGPPGEDGYHSLSTVFVPLSLADELEVELEVTLEVTPKAGIGRSGAATARDPRPRARVGTSTLDDPGVEAVRSRLEVTCPGVSWADNLVTRALLGVESATGCVFSGRIVVHKNIPTGAGLGGGSSDAAAALRTAAELVAEAGGPSLAPSQLHALARSLGADVPFFLDPRPALASGVGDLLEPLELPPLALALLLPRRELSTAEVYRTFDVMGVTESTVAFQERRLRAESDWRSLSSAWSSGRLDAETLARELAGLLSNDLESASLRLMPELASDRAELEGEDVLGVLMSGSGPTLFALCASVAAAELAAERVRARGSRRARREHVGRGPGTPLAGRPGAPHPSLTPLWALPILPGPAWALTLHASRTVALGRSQAVRQRVLVPSCVGSNPAAPASGTPVHPPTLRVPRRWERDQVPLRRPGVGRRGMLNGGASG